MTSNDMTTKRGRNYSAQFLLRFFMMTVTDKIRGEHSLSALAGHLLQQSAVAHIHSDRYFRHGHVWWPILLKHGARLKGFGGFRWMQIREQFKACDCLHGLLAQMASPTPPPSWTSSFRDYDLGPESCENQVSVSEMGRSGRELKF